MWQTQTESNAGEDNSTDGEPSHSISSIEEITCYWPGDDDASEVSTLSDAPSLTAPNDDGGDHEDGSVVMSDFDNSPVEMTSRRDD